MSHPSIPKDAPALPIRLQDEKDGEYFLHNRHCKWPSINELKEESINTNQLISAQRHKKVYKMQRPLQFFYSCSSMFISHSVIKMHLMKSSSLSSSHHPTSLPPPSPPHLLPPPHLRTHLPTTPLFRIRIPLLRLEIRIIIMRLIIMAIPKRRRLERHRLLPLRRRFPLVFTRAEARARQLRGGWYRREQRGERCLSGCGVGL